PTRRHKRHRLQKCQTDVAAHRGMSTYAGGEISLHHGPPADNTAAVNPTGTRVGGGPRRRTNLSEAFPPRRALRETTVDTSCGAQGIESAIIQHMGTVLASSPVVLSKKMAA